MTPRDGEDGLRAGLIVSGRAGDALHLVVRERFMIGTIFRLNGGLRSVGLRGINGRARAGGRGSMPRLPAAWGGSCEERILIWACS